MLKIYNFAGRHNDTKIRLEVSVLISPNISVRVANLCAVIEKELNEMQNGVDVFFLEPGSKKEMYCRICNSKCDVRRNVYGPASFAMAVGRKKKLHDVFTCPHAEEEWHGRAGKLVEEIEDTPSETVADLMRKEFEELLDEQDLHLDQ